MPVILVVEDDQVMRKAIGTILNRGGYNVLNATNGREAMEMLEKASYDVVITDLMMPYANGLEVVNRIRSDQNKKDVGIVIVSATSNEEMVTEAFSLGADDYLKKPVMAGELVSRIRKLISRQGGEFADNLPDEVEEIEAGDTDGQPTEASYLIAVSRYVNEQAAGDGIPGAAPTAANKTQIPANNAYSAENAGRGMWHMEESVSDGAHGMLREPETHDFGSVTEGSAAPLNTMQNSGSNGYMKQVVIVLAVVALLVIGMLLYIAL